MGSLPSISAVTVEVAFPEAVTLPKMVLREGPAAAGERAARGAGLRWAAEEGEGLWKRLRR